MKDDEDKKILTLFLGRTYIGAFGPPENELVKLLECGPDAFDDDSDDGARNDEDDDWDFATSSQDIASALVCMLTTKVQDVVGESGQKKTIWRRVIAELHAAYFDRFSERVEVDDGTPAGTR
jgi:hypothetical protein